MSVTRIGINHNLASIRFLMLFVSLLGRFPLSLTVMVVTQFMKGNLSNRHIENNKNLTEILTLPPDIQNKQSLGWVPPWVLPYLINLRISMFI